VQGKEGMIVLRTLALALVLLLECEAFVPGTHLAATRTRRFAVRLSATEEDVRMIVKGR
jgi:hypothetical protein